MVYYHPKREPKSKNQHDISAVNTNDSISMPSVKGLYLVEASS